MCLPWYEKSINPHMNLVKKLTSAPFYRLGPCHGRWENQGQSKGQSLLAGFLWWSFQAQAETAALRSKSASELDSPQLTGTSLMRPSALPSQLMKGDSVVDTLELSFSWSES